MDKFSENRMLGEKRRRGRPPKETAEEAPSPAPEPRGIVCPDCGGTNHYVYSSVPAGVFRKRYRVCQDCSRRFMTEEKVSP